MQEKPSDFFRLAMKMAKESGKLLTRMQNKAKIAVQKKQGDFALDADIKSEELIVRTIKKHYPHHDILTEETKHHHVSSDYLWVIDPLEGTLNYAHHIPFWALNIGLFHKGKPLLGVIHSPITKETFHALEGKGAFLNGKRIQVNNESDPLKTFFSGSVKHLANLNLSGHVLRSYGCCGLELAYVACGRLGGRIKLRGIDPYGYGASSSIIIEAGGTLTDIHGHQWKLNSGGAIASNGKLHQKLVELVNFNNTS